MATHPKHAPKSEPEDPHPAKMQPPKPAQTNVTKSPSDVATARETPIDPQEAKFEGQAGPPTWVAPTAGAKPPPPADGMTIAEEQRARAADVEAHGAASLDTRTGDDKPVVDMHALAGGAAIVKSGPQKQVQGVTVKPPTSRADY